ncbi:MAG: S41 family peptidase [Pseudoflavonifractor sp.]
MKKHVSRLLSLLLCLVLLSSSALAITPQQAGELLDTYYVDQVPDGVLTQGSVADMLHALGDPYTQYFTAQEYSAFLASMQDTKLVGIGVSGVAQENGFLVQSLLPNSPALAAGVQVLDVITAADGKTLGGKTAEEMSALLRGEEDSKVTISIFRAGTRLSYDLIRKPVVAPATTTQLLDGHLGYILCNNFGPETEGHFVEGITANDAAADRWIVDLRTNGGGDINASVQAASTLVGQGKQVYLRDKTGTYGAYEQKADALTMAPTVTLVGPNTASAAEIFASILRDQQAGLVVGSRTYGKGVAQVLRDKTTDPAFFADGSAMKVTAYRFFSPRGAATDRIGVIPQLLVEDDFAGDVAYLLCGAAPKGDTKGFLRLDMGWRWYIDLTAATKPEARAAFAALLEAVPPSAPLKLGTGGPDGWQDVTPAGLAEQYGLKDYATRSFSDVADCKYKDEINTLGTYQLLQGAGDGKYRPADGLTRGQLCAMLAQAMNCPQTMGGKPFVGSSRFTDVSADKWYAAPVNEAAALGLVDGVGGGLFRPEDPVTNQELMTIMGRLAQRLSMSFHEAQPKEALDYGHLVPYDRWARMSVWLFTESQQNVLSQPVSYLWDAPENIQPNAPASREHMAMLLYGILAGAGILTA